MACALSEDSDQPGHLPSLSRVFAVHLKKHWALNYLLSSQWRLWPDWVDANADLSLRWAQSYFVGFVMRWFILLCDQYQIDANHSDRKKWSIRIKMCFYIVNMATFFSGNLYHFYNKWTATTTKLNKMQTFCFIYRKKNNNKKQKQIVMLM